MTLWLQPVTVLDLDFVSSSQVDTAITLLWNIKFEVQLEILKLLLGDEVAAGWRIDQNALYGFPTVFVCRLTFQPVRSFPLNNFMASPHSGGALRSREGAWTPVHCRVLPSSLV